MVTARAAMGKVGETDPDAQGDSLADPTETFTYDLFAWKEFGTPVYFHSAASETHQDSGTRWLEQRTYLDGMGKPVLVKMKAEPDRVTSDPRWIGTGRVIRNNKGAPVKQYEPYFATSVAYDTEASLVTQGVTPIIHYDPLLRPIRVDLPDGTYTKVKVGVWRQEIWDASDTVEDSNWYAERMALDPADDDTDAAEASALHSETPTVVHLDPLGRAFRSIEDNGALEKYETNVELDVRGWPEAVIDARGVTVLDPTFDLLGTALRSVSPDAGSSWQLADALGRVFWTTNSEDIETSHTFDVLGRPTHLWVTESAGTPKLMQRVLYGESVDTASPASSFAASDKNLLGQPYVTLDGTGLAESLGYDFKGNPLGMVRRFSLDGTTEPDWDDADEETDYAAILTAIGDLLETEEFTQGTAWDALNRPTEELQPDGSIVARAYNLRGSPEAVSLALASAPTTFEVRASGLEYNARGQRTRLALGDDASSGTTAAVTTYTYDPWTFRLVDLETLRGSTAIQSLHYTYDAVGNITKVADAALQSVFFSNAEVEPHQSFTYDALRRLVSATGREHASQVASAPGYDAPVPLAHPNDGNALARYLETFTYDEVGNILEVAHARTTSPGTGWTRTYEYETDVSDNPISNRLITATPTGHTYTYDGLGRMTSMAHLPTMEWTWSGDLRHATRSGGEPSTGGAAYYQYAAPAMKARKVYEFSSGSRERRYFGTTEVYRRFAGTTKNFERWTIHIDDGQGRIALVERRTVDTASPPPSDDARYRYQLSNHLGTATTELDESGVVISYEEFHPYGTIAYSATDGSLDGHGPKRYRYTGKERDEDIGLNYHGARWYADWLGRWISPDPAGLVDGPNVYGYVRANPVRLRDPSGNDAEDGGPTIIDQILINSTPTSYEFVHRRSVYVNGQFVPEESFEVSHRQEWKLPSEGPNEEVIPRYLPDSPLPESPVRVNRSAQSPAPSRTSAPPQTPAPQPSSDVDGWGVAKAFLGGVFKGAVTAVAVTAVVVAGLAASPAVAVATALIASAAVARGVIQAAHETAEVWTGTDAYGRHLSTQERAERIAETAGTMLGAGIGGTIRGGGASKGGGLFPRGVDDVLKSAARPSSPGSTFSRAVQALQKKVDNPAKSEAFKGMSKTQAQADAIIREVFGAANPTFGTGVNRAGKPFIDVFNPATGRGVQLLRESGAFDTFVNLR